MANTPNIAFNSEPAQEGDNYDHDNRSQPAILEEGSSGTINTGNTSDKLPNYVSHNHDSEIYDLKWYIRSYDEINANSAWGQGGRVVGEVNGTTITFPLTVTANADIRITLDEAANQASTNIPLTNCISASPIANIATLLINLQIDIDNVFNPTAGNNTGITVENVGDILKIKSQQYLDESYILMEDGDTNNFRTLLGLINVTNYKPEYANVTGGNASNNKTLSANSDLAEVIAWADANVSDIPGTGRGLFVTMDGGDIYTQVKTGIADTLSNAQAYNGGDDKVDVLTSLDVEDITFQSTFSIGGIIRYTFNGTPDLSTIIKQNKLVVTGSTNASNDGTFTIIEINDGSDYVDVYNSSRTDGTDDETTSPATADITQPDIIKKFDFLGGDSDGEGLFSIQLSVPSDEPETGYRELETCINFTYA